MGRVILDTALADLRARRIHRFGVAMLRATVWPRASSKPTSSRFERSSCTMKTSDRAPIPGVGVVIVHEGKLLLIRRGHGANKGLWAVPGGKVEFGETREVAAAREAREETGLEIAVGEVVWAGDAIGPGDPPAWHFTLVDFAATVVRGTLCAGDDAAEIEWVPLNDVLKRPVTPTMVDLMKVLVGSRESRPFRKI
ncbi:MAG TPA: NUDIX domain-containing protein [Actinobacteria bacterium]|nr:NUDIX domain-containing protein [Actinomycetota bacterium]